MVVGGQLTKATVRAAKSVTKGYSSTQQKVRNATKNDPSSPTTRELNEIANLTFNNVDFIEIMEALDKRLNDKGKSWRHVFKALTVLEYLLLWGADTVIRYCENNLYEIKTLREFQYIDDNAVDCGMNVRQKAKDITNLVLNPSTLQSRRHRNGHDHDLRRKSRSVADFHPSRHSPQGRTRPPPEHDEDYKRATAESRRLAEQKRRATTEEDDLQRALQMSKDEEERRQRAIANSNSALFNDLVDKPKNDALIDLSDIQFDPSPALQVQYTQYQPVQPQYTVLPQFTQVQPQYTVFQAPYSYQNNEALQAEYMRQQAEWAQQQQMAAQQEEYLRQQSLLQWQQQQPSQQELPQQQPLQPQPTIGSNNPFGAPSPSPSLSSVTTSSSRMSPATPYSTRSLSRASDKHTHLAGLYANRTDDGMDTFGNTGLLRFGPTDAGRIAASRTGLDNNNFSTAY